MIARSLCALGAFALMSVPALAQLPAPPDPWTPPLGIPAPQFGIVQKAGNTTVWVDNRHPASSDAGNPAGSPSKPRKTIPSLLPAGSVVEVKGGPYIGLTVGANGSAVAPVFIKGVGDPVITTAAGLKGQPVTIGGSYLIIEGVVFEGVQVGLHADLSFFALRRSTVRNFSPPRNSAAIGVGGTNIVIFANEIHNNGDPKSDKEVDIHGIKPDTGDSYLWVVDNHIHDNGGDSVQIGNANSPEPWVHTVYVGRNQMHDDRENAVDIKRARDIVVSQNTMYGYERTATSAGEAAVTHNMAERVWFLNNVVRDSNQGLVCTGAVGYFVIGNVIYNIVHLEGTEYDPGSLYGPHALLTYNTQNSMFVNNTIWNVDAGISYASGTTKAEFVNNIIGGLLQESHHIAVGNSLAAGASVNSNNLLHGKGRIQWGGKDGGCRDCRNGDPAFIDAKKGDFRTTEKSPALNRGVPHPVYALYNSLYGVGIDRDLNGVLRPVGMWDIGAFESPADAAAKK